MKYLVGFIFLILNWNATAEPIYDTIYHPVYSGKQLIELRIHANTLKDKGFIEIDQSTNNNGKFPKYLLRDSLGKLLTKYNDFYNRLRSFNRQ